MYLVYKRHLEIHVNVMPAKIGWLVEGAVIYQNWWGVGTLTDAEYVNARSLEMYAAFPDRPLIHTIANAVHQSRSEGSIIDYRNAYTILDDPRTGWIVITTGNPVIRFIGNVVVQMRRQDKDRLRMLSDPTAGIEFLKMADRTIPWDTMDTTLIKRLDSEINTPVR